MHSVEVEFLAQPAPEHASRSSIGGGKELINPKTVLFRLDSADTGQLICVVLLAFSQHRRYIAGGMRGKGTEDEVCTAIYRIIR